MYDEVLFMKEIVYGEIRLRLSDYMEKHNISINQLAYRAEMQRTQLKQYMKNDVQRIDLNVMSRLCYALDCDLFDLLEYLPPNG